MQLNNIISGKHTQHTSIKAVMFTSTLNKTIHTTDNMTLTWRFTYSYAIHQVKNYPRHRHSCGKEICIAAVMQLTTYEQADNYSNKDNA
jgi:hypothetical protein